MRHTPTPTPTPTPTDCHPLVPDDVRVQGEIMGPGKYENVGTSQSVLIMINTMIFTRTR
eukprot:SAG25_NODE_4006_length_909_cov_1.019753_1_plen_58_part_10